MANTHHIMPVSGTGFIGALSAALSSKYGVDVTMYYQDTGNLIFACTALSVKIIKICFTSDGDLTAYYGDAWTSGTTITNQVQFLNLYASDLAYETKSIDLVLGDNFMLINNINVETRVYSQMLIVGKATNGNSLVFGLVGSSYASANGQCLGYDLTQATPVHIKTFSGGFAAPNNKIYKFPLIIVCNDTNVILTNADGSQATITDLYISSFVTGVNWNVVTSNSLITSCNMLDSSGVARMSTGLIAEW